jgi:hypothetical protein
MADAAVDRAVQDAADAFTVARLRTQRLLRRFDGLGDGYASVAAEPEAIRAALDRLRGDLRGIMDAAGGKRERDGGG